MRLPQSEAAELLKPNPTKFDIPVALEVTITSKEVLVRRPAPPGIRHFFFSQTDSGIVSTMCPTCDSGFTVMGSDVGVLLTFQSNAPLEIVL